MAETRDAIRLEELYDRQGDRLYNYLHWLSGDPEVALDVSARSFLQFAVQRKIETDPRRAALILYRLATKLAAGCESRRLWKERLTLGRIGRGWVKGGEATHTSAEDEAFRAALRRISVRARSILLLREMEQVPAEQLSEIAGLSASALRRRLFAAREEMWRTLGRPTGETKECRRAWSLLSDSREGGLVLHEQEELRAHLERCPWCTDRSKDYEALARLFQALPRQTPPESLRDRVFGTPTSLTTPWIVPSVGLALAVIIGVLLATLGISVGTAVWQSGLLAAFFERPFAGPAVYVANAGERGSIAVVAARGERVTRVVPVGAQPLSLTLSPDHRWLYIAHDLGVGVLDTRENAVVRTIQVPGGAQRILVHPEGRRLYALGVARGPVPGRLWVYDSVSQARLDQAVVGLDTYEANLSPDGRWAYVVGGREGILTVVETGNLGHTQNLRLPRAGYDYALVAAPSGRVLYVVDRRRGTVTVVETPRPEADVLQHTIRRTLPLGSPRGVSAPASPGARPTVLAAGGAAVSADGKRLYVALLPPEEGLGVYATDSFGEETRVARRIDGVAIGPEALYLTAAADGVLLVLDPASYRVVATVPVGENPHSVVHKP